jgi:hypothetical protein
LVELQLKLYSNFMFIRTTPINSNMTWSFVIPSDFGVQCVIGSNLVNILKSLLVFHFVLYLPTLFYIPDQIKNQRHSSKKKKAVIIASSVTLVTGMVILGLILFILKKKDRKEGKIT